MQAISRKKPGPKPRAEQRYRTSISLSLADSALLDELGHSEWVRAQLALVRRAREHGVLKGEA